MLMSNVLTPQVLAEVSQHVRDLFFLVFVLQYFDGTSLHVHYSHLLNSLGRRTVENEENISLVRYCN